MIIVYKRADCVVSYRVEIRFQMYSPENCLRIRLFVVASHKARTRALLRAFRRLFPTRSFTNVVKMDETILRLCDIKQTDLKSRDKSKDTIKNKSIECRKSNFVKIKCRFLQDYQSIIITYCMTNKCIITYTE